MLELALSGGLVPVMFAIVASAGFPPVATGAFWAIVTLYGVVSILFDDETPRGIPGIEVIQEILQRREEAKTAER